jgi:hypothetical protein
MVLARTVLLLSLLVAEIALLLYSIFYRHLSRSAYVAVAIALGLTVGMLVRPAFARFNRWVDRRARG